MRMHGARPLRKVEVGRAIQIEERALPDLALDAPCARTS
jgi:hypothetical protein